jgi:hypothetical protein
MPARLLDGLLRMILQIHDSNECAKKDLAFKKRECSNCQADFDICRLSCGFPVLILDSVGSHRLTTIHICFFAFSIPISDAERAMSRRA